MLLVRLCLRFAAYITARSERSSGPGYRVHKWAADLAAGAHVVCIGLNDRGAARQELGMKRCLLGVGISRLVVVGDVDHAGPVDEPVVHFVGPAVTADDCSAIAEVVVGQDRISCGVLLRFDGLGLRRRSLGGGGGRIHEWASLWGMPIRYPMSRPASRRMAQGLMPCFRPASWRGSVAESRDDISALRWAAKPRSSPQAFQAVTPSRLNTMP